MEEVRVYFGVGWRMLIFIFMCKTLCGGGFMVRWRRTVHMDEMEAHSTAILCCKNI